MVALPGALRKPGKPEAAASRRGEAGAVHAAAHSVALENVAQCDMA
jgi:hypothetical protein